MWPVSFALWKLIWPSGPSISLKSFVYILWPELVPSRNRSKLLASGQWLTVNTMKAKPNPNVIPTASVNMKAGCRLVEDLGINHAIV